MKKLLIMALFVPMYAFGQKDTTGLNLSLKDGVVTYGGVVNITDKNKADLYINAKRWFVNYFRSANDVLQVQDKETGELMGKGIVFIKAKNGFGSPIYLPALSTIHIECKDGKYRYRFYNIIVYQKGQSSNDKLINDAMPPGMSFSTEQLVGKLLGTYKFGMYGPTKSGCRSLLTEIKESTDDIAESLKKSMDSKPDNF